MTTALVETLYLKLFEIQCFPAFSISSCWYYYFTIYHVEYSLFIFICFSLISVVLSKQVSYRYHGKRKSPINGLFTPFMGLCLLFKLAKFGLILVVPILLSILSCIDNIHLFHSLFFIAHIFSTNPVPLLYCNYCV